LRYHQFGACGVALISLSEKNAGALFGLIITTISGSKTGDVAGGDSGTLDNYMIRRDFGYGGYAIGR
jgi:hypothetical protein